MKSSRFETLCAIVRTRHALLPGEWAKVKIERGEKARLYANAQEQTTLLVNDLKQKVTKGAVALSIGTGTVAHFCNLRISP